MDTTEFDHVDTVLLDVIRAGGPRLRRLIEKAIAAHLRDAASGDADDIEDTIGSLENHLLDSLCGLRGLNAAMRGHGDQREALAEAGASLVRLSERLADLRRDALVNIPAEDEEAERE